MGCWLLKLNNSLNFVVQGSNTVFVYFVPQEFNFGLGEGALGEGEGQAVLGESVEDLPDNLLVFLVTVSKDKNVI